MSLYFINLITLKTEVVITGVWALIGVIISGVVFSAHDVSAPCWSLGVNVIRGGGVGWPSEPEPEPEPEP